MNPTTHAHLLSARQCLACLNPAVRTLRDGVRLWNEFHDGKVTSAYRRTIVKILEIRVLPVLGERSLAEIHTMDSQQLVAAVPSWQQNLTTDRQGRLLFEMKCLMIVIQWLHAEGRIAKPRFLPLPCRFESSVLSGGGESQRARPRPVDFTVPMLKVLTEAFDAECGHNPRLRLFFRMVSLIGIRPQEALSANFGDFSKGYRTLTVPRRLCGTFPQHPVPESIRELLLELPGKGNRGPIFPGDAASSLHRCNRLLRAALLKAGLDPRIHFSQLRKMVA